MSLVTLADKTSSLSLTYDLSAKEKYYFSADKVVREQEKDNFSEQNIEADKYLLCRHFQHMRRH